MSAAESRDSIPITVEEPQAPTDHHRTIRPGTSSTDMRPNTAASSKTHLTDPFASPFSSRPSSVRGMSSSHVSFPNDTQANSRTPFSQPGLSARSSARFTIISGSGVSPTNPAYASGVAKPKAVRMKSHAITEDEVHKPWNDTPNPRARFAYFLTYAVIFLGLAGGIIQCYFAWRNVRIDRSPLCVVMDENFDDEDAVFGPNGSFMREVNMDGFGNGEFEMTTASRNNSYVKDGFLYIVPTLTSDEIGQSAVFDGAVYNITGCTFNETAPNNGFIESGGQTFFDVNGYNRACSAVSNATAGTIINPVQSARLTTRNKASIRFGRVEIRAKMPNGDWLWPALWMLPRDNVYGPWPLSGEIDIVESRGNGIRYTARGSNSVQGTLNWGPAPQLNGAQFSFSWWTDKRKSFGSDFHTYLLEWTEEFLRISVDSRLHTLLDLRFNKPFFQRGNFPQVVFNGSSLAPLQNPWTNGTNATPFDQEFYLIMNVAVGGTNGWFPEAQGDKPWLDRSGTPMRDFASAEAKWYPTWPTNVQDRAMIVDYVKMWKHC